MGKPDKAKENPLGNPAMNRNLYRGLGLGIAAPVLWSSSGMFIKLISMPALQLTMLRSAIAALVFLPLLFRSKTQRQHTGLKYWLDFNLIALMVCYTAMSLTFVAATQWTTAANAIALQSTAPFWVFALTCLLARRVLWENLPPVLMILAGLAVLLLEPAQGTTLLGNLTGALSGICFALTSFFFSRTNRPAAEVMFFINGFGALALAAMLALNPGGLDFSGTTNAEWISLLYLGIIQTGLGHLSHYLSMRHITINQASILSLLEPLLNPIWVFLAIGEIPSNHGFAGGALVFCGIGLDGWLRLRRKGVHPPQEAKST